MKKFWKALGIAALAAFVPVRFQKDEETGKKKYQSLLLSVDVGPGEDETGTDIGINLGEGVLTDLGRKVVGARREAAMFTDDPAEAAVEAADLAQAAADAAQAAADEAQAAADELQAAADEAQAAADELHAAAEDGAEEATEEDFDPEL